MEPASRPDSEPPALAGVVVASNEVVRRGVADLLRSIPDFGPVHEAAHPDRITALPQPARIDLVVVAAADAGWLPAAQPMLAEWGAQVLVLVDAASIGVLAGPSARLADGFLWERTLSAAGLREAVRRTRGGEVPVPPELTHALLSRSDHPAAGSRSRSVNLTSREQEVLSLLVEGLSNKQIARRLSISSHGAKRLVTSVMLKLDAPNRTLAAVTAVRAGLVNGDR